MTCPTKLRAPARSSRRSRVGPSAPHWGSNSIVAIGMTGDSLVGLAVAWIPPSAGRFRPNDSRSERVMDWSSITRRRIAIQTGTGCLFADTRTRERERYGSGSHLSRDSRPRLVHSTVFIQRRNEEERGVRPGRCLCVCVAAPVCRVTPSIRPYCT